MRCEVPIKEFRTQKISVPKAFSVCVAVTYALATGADCMCGTRRRRIIQATLGASSDVAFFEGVFI